MSAYLALAYQNRAELLTDGAVTFDDGTLSDIMTKVWTSRFVPFAITGAGDARQVENICTYLIAWAALAGVDGALDALAGMPKPDGDLTMVIAAVSEESGAGVWVYSTRDDPHGCGKGLIPACTVTRWEGLVAMGSGLDAADVASTGLTRADFADGIARGGVKLMEAWRRKACVSPARPELGPGYYIGGKVDHTVVSASGVTIQEAHRWLDDEVGNPIKP
ncbi:hypothetical protein [Paradevosia shaoguanensis]|uniref:hypothetical protein n=1 Tax=Paradevosia shaoguanensis TaxID=1335043 RepID=UPI0019344805|nr:hypothetical protein [Paradevosia shaoguanensis]